MTLDNLLGMSLERIEADPLTIQRLLEAAQRNIGDAQLEVVSNENRFDAAYKTIMQMANTALQANGYRTLSSKPGHHQTMIQTLPKTIGLDTEIMIVLRIVLINAIFSEICKYSTTLLHIFCRITAKSHRNLVTVD